MGKFRLEVTEDEARVIAGALFDYCESLEQAWAEPAEIQQADALLKRVEDLVPLVKDAEVRVENLADDLVGINLPEGLDREELIRLYHKGKDDDSQRS